MAEPQPINAQPTKQFFVDMMTRDIALEQAVLDLVDNCIDGAKRLRAAGTRLEGQEIAITVNAQEFLIVDNCGGFDIATARDYAFRFGRAPGKEAAPHSIGQFGVGMKRALFKFGRHFRVRSATRTEKWAVDVDVEAWEGHENWFFPWAEFGDESALSEQKPGTEIRVDRLRPEVSSRFGTQQFTNTIIGLIKSTHRQFIAEGISVSVNGRHVSAASLYVLFTPQLKPGVDRFKFTGPDDRKPVDVRVVVGVGESAPREAGWYIVCNGRVVLEADRRPVTGWGLLEADTARIYIPSFHNQFARFRGIAWFDSEDSARVPWNTMKTDVDQESPVWQQTFRRMVDMMRPVMDFLNELDNDIDEFTKEKSPLLHHMSQGVRANTESLLEKTPFRAPLRADLEVPVRTTKIQYSRPVEDIEFLERALGVWSAKAVGERTFDLALKKQRAE